MKITGKTKHTQDTNISLEKNQRNTGNAADSCLYTGGIVTEAIEIHLVLFCKVKIEFKVQKNVSPHNSSVLIYTLEKNASGFSLHRFQDAFNTVNQTILKSEELEKGIINIR